MLEALMSFLMSYVKAITGTLAMLQNADFSPFLSAVLGALPVIVVIGIVGLILKSLNRGL